MTNERNQLTTSSALSDSSSASSLCEDTLTTATSTALPPPSTATITWLSQPSEHDIVCGRGKNISAFAGNLKFRSMILARRDEYQATFKRDDKSRITMEIVQALQTGPCPSRFLIKDTETDLYREVDMEYAREKVSHALRSRWSSSSEKNKRKRFISVNNDNSSPQQLKQQRTSNPTSRRRVNCEWTKEEEAHIQLLLREQQQLLQTLLGR